MVPGSPKRGLPTLAWGLDRHWPSAVSALTWVAVSLAVIAWLLSGCQTGPVGGWDAAAGEPAVRVRIAKSLGEVQINASSLIRFAVTSPTSGATGFLPRPVQMLRGPVKVRRRAGTFIVESRGSQPIQWAAATLQVQAQNRGPLILNNANSYPRELVLQAAFDPDRAGAGTFDVINNLPMELYLPGVLDRELPSDWHPSAYEAQAIAARSYALDLCAQRRSAPYDLESTQASQVYGGMTRNPKALRAVQRTYGLVLTYENRVLPAYYSSTCGGVGQDAAAVFPKGLAIPPLQGHFHGAWCSASKYYRWGPIVRSRAELTARLAAWGRGNRHPAGGTSTIRDVSVSMFNAANRPTHFRIIDVVGRTFNLNAEQFRMACNADAPGLPAVYSDQQIRSSFVSVEARGDQFIFFGSGFGHGVGLCQWGAEGLAQRGYSHPAILEFYYPRAVIKKLY